MINSRYIKFFVDRETKYLDALTGYVINESDMQEICDRLHEEDSQKGYKDALAGYYDKWYRNNRDDQGKAYDGGVEKAKKDGAVILTIIPCAGGKNEYK